MADRISAAALRETRVVPHLDVRRPPGKNLVYSATLAMAWAELERRMGRPIDLSPPWPTAAALRKVPVAGIVDEASSVVLAGLGRDGIVERLRAETGRKLGPDSAPSVGEIGEEDVVVYACLHETLAFTTALIPSEYGLHFGGREVRAFGVWSEGDRAIWERRAQQIVVHRYRGSGDFVLELRTASEGDRLFVACVAPEKTLGETVRAVFGAVSDSPEAPLEDMETVLIPCVSLSVSRTFDDVRGRKLTEGGEARIAEVRQDTDFTLDHRGARVHSEAVLGIATPMPPRSFYANKPFLVMASRAGQEEPYFCLWVETPEVLVPFTREGGAGSSA